MTDEKNVASTSWVTNVKPPLSITDYRPILVVLILSRILGRLVVKGYHYPAVRLPSVAELVQGRYAFRLTGSTIAALIDLLQKNYQPVAKQRICGSAHSGLLEGIRLRETPDTHSKNGAFSAARSCLQLLLDGPLF